MNRIFGIMCLLFPPLFGGDSNEEISHTLNRLVNDANWPSQEIEPLVITNTKCARLGRLSAKGLRIPYERLIRLRAQRKSKNNFWERKVRSGKVFFYFADEAEDPDRHPVFVVAIDGREINGVKACRADFTKLVLQPYGIHTEEAYGGLILNDIAVFKVRPADSILVPHVSSFPVENVVVEKERVEGEALHFHVSSRSSEYSAGKFTYTFPSWSSTKHTTGNELGSLASKKRKRVSSEGTTTEKKFRIENGPLDEVLANDFNFGDELGQFSLLDYVEGL